MPGQGQTYGELGGEAGEDASYADLTDPIDSRNYLLEVEGLRRQTSITLATEGRIITINRPGTWVDSADGGQKFSGAPITLTPQLFFFQQVRGDARYFQDDTGERQEHDAVLVGVDDANVQAEDEFTVNGRTFRVSWVHEDRRYETRARCRRLA